MSGNLQYTNRQMVGIHIEMKQKRLSIIKLERRLAGRFKINWPDSTKKEIEHVPEMSSISPD